MADRLGRPALLALGLMTWVVLANAAAPSVRPAIVRPAMARPAMTSALEALDACLARLNPEIDVGFERIAARCPQLAHRLEESGWSPWLPRDWKRHGNDLSAGGLRELREILSRESTARKKPQDPAHGLSVAGLPAVLADLATANSPRVGWWARTKDWLRDVFERSEQDSDAGWLGRLVGQNGLSQVVVELISYVALMLVALLAAIIVINELRVSGVLSRLRMGRGRGAIAHSSEAEDRELTWDDVGAAPASLRPQLLLEVIIARLTAASHLPPARALTVRELTRAARLSDEADRERLSQLARISERVRFSSAEVPREELAAAVERGRVLFERLATTAASVPEAQARS